MHGPAPKAPELRQRRNKRTSHTKLKPAGDLVPVRPELPALQPGDPPWHPLTVAWWRDSWESPMAHEFVHADIHGLILLADIIDQYWRTRSASLLSEIRLQRQCYGLTPLDRRRLEWEVDRGEEAKARTQRRTAPETKKPKRKDPRKVLEFAG